ncbi:MAG: hypothetical protein ACRCUE_05400 [Bosea sp. (in: a-proteobacteria)]
MNTATNQRLKIQVIDVCKWAICLPALAIWPILSALPAFAIVGRSNFDFVLPNLMFFMTGFWPVIVALLAYRFVSGRLMQAGMATLPRFGGLALGSYATVWTIAYGVFVGMAG